MTMLTLQLQLQLQLQLLPLSACPRLTPFLSRPLHYSKLARKAIKMHHGAADITKKGFMEEYDNSPNMNWWQPGSKVYLDNVQC